MTERGLFWTRNGRLQGYVASAERVRDVLGPLPDIAEEAAPLVTIKG